MKEQLKIDQNYITDRVNDLTIEISNNIDNTFNKDKESFMFYVEFNNDKNNTITNRVYFQWIIYRNLALTSNSSYCSKFVENDYIEVKDDIDDVSLQLKNSIINFFSALLIADLNSENLVDYFDNEFIDATIDRIIKRD